MSDTHAKRPTLKTIADLTGLSLSTVSLSLRDGNNLRQETRDKVAQAAQAIGYVPNRAGVRLRTGRTHVLALSLSADKHIIDYTRLLIQGIGKHIHGSKFHLNVIPEFDLQNSMETVNYILENRSADGVILTHTSARDPRVQLLMKNNFPFVSHGRTQFRKPHAYHDFNAERYVALAVERLVSKGHNKLLLASMDNGTTNFSTITEGFVAATQKAGVQGKIVKNPELLETTASARLFGQQLAADSKGFLAIICNNELTGLAIIAGLSHGGYVLGRDYDMLCKQTTEILPMLHPEMDTVAEDLLSTGTELAKLLVARINNESIDTLQTLQEPMPRWRSG